jgi:CHAT domain-containing protein
VSISRALGETAAVEYVEVGEKLVALCLVDEQVTATELNGSMAASECEWLRFALGQLARGTAGARRDTARKSANASARRLDEQLLLPLLRNLGDRALVVVPTGWMHAIPWSSLPSLRARPVTMIPSLGVLSDLVTRRRRGRTTVLVSGPRLAHAVAEVRHLASLHQGCVVLHGRTATAEATLAALDGARLAHIACHGHFRRDSPLFSSLELADGPLNVYELQTLRRPPETLVLSACDLGSSGVHPGDELLGLSAALLAMGTRTIVASVVPVPDAEARRLMVELHRRLLAGERPAAALAAAQAGARVPGYVCLGCG